MEHRANLMRLMGGLIWVMIPVISLMLFLPHEIYINHEAALLLLFLTLLLNFAMMLLPFRESLLERHFDLLMGFFRLVLIGLLCVAIYYTGGARSPLFAFFLLVTAFSTSLTPSLSSAVVTSGTSAAAYLFTILAFTSPARVDIQLISAQVFFLLLFSIFINRVGAESREQARERASAMEELKALSEVDRASSSFVSAVSFEMRTPLTSIQGFSEMLTNMDLEPQKEREYVEIISREADNLSRLVEDLLDISRLESGKVQMNKEVARLDQLLNLSLPALVPSCEPSEVTLNIPPELPDVLVDQQRIKRVFDSIFGYIARKSGRGSEVRVSAKTEGEEVVMTINFRNRETAKLYDNGSLLFPPIGGQDEEDLELAMARRIVLAHKGSVNLIRASGGWHAIVLRLPMLMARDLVKTQPAPFGPIEDNPT